MSTVQSTFTPASQKIEEVLARTTRHDCERVVGALSGGGDSVLANYVAATQGEEYGTRPDVILHANTGLGAPQTQLTAQILAAILDIPYVEGNNGTLAERVLEHGWPAHTSEGHFYERIERKDDVFDKMHASIPQEQLWISGARATESKKRSSNVPDSGVAEDSRRTRQTWCSPLAGVTSEEKGQMILDYGLPVSESYLLLGLSGECLGCAYDDVGLLTDLDVLAPNVAWAARCLTGLLVMMDRHPDTDTDITPKQLCWGWDPATDDTGGISIQSRLDETDHDPGGDWIGCGGSSCGDRDIPDWVRKLPDWQIVTYDDVMEWHRGNRAEIIERFA